MPPGTQPVKTATAIQASRGLNATVRRKAAFSAPITQCRLNQGERRNCRGIGSQDARELLSAFDWEAALSPEDPAGQPGQEHADLRPSQQFGDDDQREGVER